MWSLKLFWIEFHRNSCLRHIYMIPFLGLCVFMFCEYILCEGMKICMATLVEETNVLFTSSPCGGKNKFIILELHTQYTGYRVLRHMWWLRYAWFVMRALILATWGKERLLVIVYGWVSRPCWDKLHFKVFPIYNREHVCVDRPYKFFFSQSLVVLFSHVLMNLFASIVHCSFRTTNTCWQFSL